MIYEIRGKQVMLDSDLAKLYNVETKRINEAVKNNPDKFPERYLFRITDKEYDSLKSKISTSKGGSRKGHTAFVEQGVYMLATILKSDIATAVSIRIMDTFVAMRHYISDELLIQRHFNEMTIKHESQIKLLQKSFDKLQTKNVYNEIFFNGQIYDAYSKILDIFNECKKELIIIDNYVDKTILDIIRNLKVRVIIITKHKGLLKKIDIEKYNAQYNNLEIIYNDTFHDRYFIIDKRIVYHCGTSLNKIGSKTFSINNISDYKVINNLINEVKKL